MNWWQAIILGIVQGLTEFLPVSSSGHLMIVKELLGVNSNNFIDFAMTVHLATVCSTVVVFWQPIKQLIQGLFKFKYNTETDYFLKIIVSMLPVGIVGIFFKDKIEGLFGEDLFTVGVFLVITALLLFISDQITIYRQRSHIKENRYTNGISYWQAFIVGVGQAFAVAPGLSRSGTTIATGLISGVKKEVIAQFSFLMVLAPIIGEQILDISKVAIQGGGYGNNLSLLTLVLAFISAFIAGLLACKLMLTIVRKTKLTYFAIYCLIVALLIFMYS